MGDWLDRPRVAAMGVLAGALVLLAVAGCEGTAPAGGPEGSVQPELVTPRDGYDTEASWEEIVRPYFPAISMHGDVVSWSGGRSGVIKGPVGGSMDRTSGYKGPVGTLRDRNAEAREGDGGGWFSYAALGGMAPGFGDAEEVVVRDGKAKVRFQRDGEDLFLDPLGLAPELLGEHPVHRVFRLLERGVPVASELEEALASGKGIDGYFHTLEFEYLRGHTTAGVVAEVFPDGTFLVIPFEKPEQWRSERPEVASPTHYHVNPRALTSAGSELAQTYEATILGLSFQDQRYPPAEVARQQCDVYREALAGEEYRRLLDAAGYELDPMVEAGRLAEGGKSVGDMVTELLKEAAMPGVRYFGYEGAWLRDTLWGLGAEWLEECDTAGGLRQEDVPGGPGSYYLQVRKSLHEDKRQRYKVARLEGDGPPQFIYDAPGIMLTALPLPGQSSKWLMSTEGWPAAGADFPADPRWQSVYMVDLDVPEEYQKVKFPIEGFPKAPESGLYGSAAAFTADGRFLVNVLYGFSDEGGGLWVTDVSAEDFHTRPESFKRLVEWDHALSWVLLEPSTLDSPGPYSLLLTGKEVADNFAMTANLLKVSFDGLNSEVQSRQRLLQMVGWNPVPFAVQELGDGQFRVAVETFYNYESSLLPRAKGVYILPVDLKEER